jgi:hypothetical protein
MSPFFLQAGRGTYINTSTFFKGESMFISPNSPIPVLTILVLSADSKPSEIIAKMSGGLEVSESEHGVLSPIGGEGAGGVEVSPEIEGLGAPVGQMGVPVGIFQDGLEGDVGVFD